MVSVDCIKVPFSKVEGLCFGGAFEKAYKTKSGSALRVSKIKKEEVKPRPFSAEDAEKICQNQPSRRISLSPNHVINDVTQISK